MIYDLLVLGHPRLRTKCWPVQEFGKDITDLIADLRDTMCAAGGVGLAAPQIGVTLRVAVVEVEKFKLELVNPVLISVEGPKTLAEEGCLSVPDIFAEVPRCENITVTSLDPATGEPHNYQVKGFLARAIQHEIDHLDGKLFIDYLGEFKKRQALQQWSAKAKNFPNYMRSYHPY